MVFGGVLLSVGHFKISSFRFLSIYYVRSCLVYFTICRHLFNTLSWRAMLHYHRMCLLPGRERGRPGRLCYEGVLDGGVRRSGVFFTHDGMDHASLYDTQVYSYEQETKPGGHGWLRDSGRPG